MMARSHAASGLAAAPLLAQPGQVALCALFTAGFAVFPGLDHPSSTVTTSFGPLTKAASAVLATLDDIFAPGGPPVWQDRALCAQTDPEAFFRKKSGSTREANRICQGCEVKGECLEYALADAERFGIWGGLSVRERRPLLKRAAAS